MYVVQIGTGLNSAPKLNTLASIHYPSSSAFVTVADSAMILHAQSILSKSSTTQPRWGSFTKWNSSKMAKRVIWANPGRCMSNICNFSKVPTMILASDLNPFDSPV